MFLNSGFLPWIQPYPVWYTDIYICIHPHLYLHKHLHACGKKGKEVVRERENWWRFSLISLCLSVFTDIVFGICQRKKYIVYLENSQISQGNFFYKTVETSFFSVIGIIWNNRRETHTFWFTCGGKKSSTFYKCTHWCTEQCDRKFDPAVQHGKHNL